MTGSTMLNAVSNKVERPIMRVSAEARFWVKVQRGQPKECWQWLGHIDQSHGYGDFRVRDKHVKAHRFSYALVHGPIPRGMFVLHSCDNPSCVNPAHLSLGTFEDNSEDMVRKGRGRGRLSPERRKGA